VSGRDVSQSQRAREKFFWRKELVVNGSNSSLVTATVSGVWVENNFTSNRGGNYAGARST